MKKITYTPEAAEKLRAIKKSISIQYGSRIAGAIVGSITAAIRGLLENEKKGPTVAAMYGINSDYRYIYISKNYVFYRIEKDYIRVINIYNEKEDFMWLLFGIDTTPQKTFEYWKE